MAAHLIEIKLSWENEVGFAMKAKLDAEDEITIVEVTENARIESIWPKLRDLCIQFFYDELTSIGTEMKA